MELVLLLLAYLIPSLVAAGRKHQNMAPIIVVNIFLGWTLIGWVVALAMAVSPVKAPPATAGPGPS